MALRRARTRAIAVGLGLVVALGAGAPATAVEASKESMTAYLDGVRIRLGQVGAWFCDDFSYPAIHCFSNPIALQARTTMLLSLTAIDYVTVYENGSFSGSFMHMSQDYTALVTIGWNDRISSLKGRNRQTGHLYADWFYGGSSYSVCCNSQITALGAFDNSFSSVHRN